MSTSAPATSTVLSRRDLRFLLHEWLRVEELCGRERFADQSREQFDDVLELAERIATERFATHNRTADANEPHLGPDGEVVLIPEIGEALRVFADAGLIGAAMDERLGGLQLPQVVASAVFAWFQAANVATSAYPFLTAAAASMLVAHASPEQVGRWVPPMIEGRVFGTMCLSEPGAGSSLADVTTRAELQADGSYRLFGSKMWISGGDHELSENIVHLVLAKIPGGPPGVKGISLFIVPRRLEDGERNDIVLAGLNHKMGYRATVNTVLGFGEGAYQPGGAAGAVGELVGVPHQGLAYMFHMMNEARIGVGVGATCLGYSAYLKAVQYARERSQGRLAGAKDPTAPQVPIIQHADVKRMLLAQKSYAEGGLALALYCGRLLDEQGTAPGEADRRRAGLLLDVLTPIAKSWPAQWCLAGNDLAIQVHGGYGYTRDYDVEQLYRDNRLNAIHEGTTGIQALDLLGRKVVAHGGAGLDLLVETIGASVERARAVGGAAAEYAAALAAGVERLIEVTATIHAHPDGDVALANATTYLEAVGHIVVAWIWLEQLLAVGDRADPFYDGKRYAARYFFRHELPRITPQLDLLASLDPTNVEMQEEWF